MHTALPIRKRAPLGALGNPRKSVEETDGATFWLAWGRHWRTRIDRFRTRFTHEKRGGDDQVSVWIGDVRGLPTKKRGGRIVCANKPDSAISWFTREDRGVEKGGIAKDRANRRFTRVLTRRGFALAGSERRPDQVSKTERMVHPRKKRGGDSRA